MSQILTVFGASGQQGHSVIDHVLNDPDLSSTFSIRAVTRNTTSPQAKALSEHVEVVQADGDDPASLKSALAGTHTVFIMTAASFPPSDSEFNTAKTIADAAVDAGARFIIFSTAPSIAKLSHGKFTKVAHFEAKYNAEQYIRALPIKSAFIAPGFFLENFTNEQISSLILEKIDTEWVFKGMGSTDSTIPLLAAREDIGKFVGAILADSERYDGQILYAATKEFRMTEIAQCLSKASGRTVSYRQLSANDFRDRLPGRSEVLLEVFAAVSEFGYFGSGSAQLVERSAREASGRLLMPEEYFEKYPFKLSE